MNRREAFLAVGAGAALVLPRELLDAAQAGDLSADQVEALLRSIVGIEALPGEAERIKKALLESRATRETDPRLQPALAFDPEVEV
jgi:hypothetical protein